MTTNIQQEVFDITPLKNAIIQLENSLRYYHSDLIQSDEGLLLQLRAAAIQAFEFTYELSVKMIKRYFKQVLLNPAELEDMSFPNLIREASNRGLLLSDLTEWKRYRQERGTTSHTYDQNKAIAIFEEIPKFLKEAKYLLEQLEQRGAKVYS
jgi:nucleotidyltransferase substrate binding protein (TIGR01987 family)